MRRLGPVVAMLLFCLVGALPPEARAQWQPQELTCRPELLYQGDTLTIDLPDYHRGWELAVDPPHGTHLMVTFLPGPRDKIDPVISPDQFGKMTRLELLTTKALGSPSGPSKGPCFPRVDGPPQPIFTKSGIYRVMTAAELDSKYEQPDWCVVTYCDHRRPKKGEKPPCAEAVPQPQRSVAPARAPAKPAPTPAPLVCQPAVLHRGDTLTVDLPMPHGGYELGVACSPKTRPV